MTVAVEPLDLGDDATLAELVAIQRAGYIIEAQLIGAESLPPLRETPEQVRASGETFLGALEDGALLGAVSYRRLGDLVDIHRLVVHPDAFRRGIATALLDALDARETSAQRWTVGTGAGNGPALALYERRGFRRTEERDVGDGLRWIRLDRAGGR